MFISQELLYILKFIHVHHFLSRLIILNLIMSAILIMLCFSVIFPKFSNFLNNFKK